MVILLAEVEGCVHLARWQADVMLGEGHQAHPVRELDGRSWCGALEGG
jgi:hypothetical protein